MVLTTVRQHGTAQHPNLTNMLNKDMTIVPDHQTMGFNLRPKLMKNNKNQSVVPIIEINR